jgi:hypothetical protein
MADGDSAHGPCPIGRSESFGHRCLVVEQAEEAAPQPLFNGQQLESHGGEGGISQPIGH